MYIVVYNMKIDLSHPLSSCFVFFCLFGIFFVCFLFVCLVSIFDRQRAWFLW